MSSPGEKHLLLYKPEDYKDPNVNLLAKSLGHTDDLERGSINRPFELRLWRTGQETLNGLTMKIDELPQPVKEEVRRFANKRARILLSLAEAIAQTKGERERDLATIYAYRVRLLLLTSDRWATPQEQREFGTRVDRVQKSIDFDMRRYISAAQRWQRGEI